MLSVSSASEETNIIQAWDVQSRESGVAQSHTDIRMHVTHLNGLLFDGNVLQASGGATESWVVAFCPSWWDGCQQMQQHLSKAAATWHSRLNADVFSAGGRFAIVDCATDKPLCNREGVETYPTIAHYGQGQQLGQISLSARTMKSKLEKWITSQLQPSELEVRPAADVQLQGFFNAGGGMDIILMLLAVACSIRMGSRSGFTKVTTREPDKPQPPTMQYIPLEWQHTRTSIKL